MTYLRKIYKSCFLDLGMSKVTVADIMTRDPIKVGPEANLIECARKMVRKRVGSIVIAKNKKLLGYITEHDILWALIKKSKEDLSHIKAIDISPKKIITLKSSVILEKAIKKIKATKFERFPVVDNGELVGIITVKDILDFNPEYYPEFEELEMVRKEEEKLKRMERAREGKRREGICEECGNQDILIKHNGMLICESCINSS